MNPDDPKKDDAVKDPPKDEPKKGNGHNEPPDETALVIEVSLPPEDPPKDSEKH